MSASESAYRVEALAGAKCLHISQQALSPEFLAEIGLGIMALVADPAGSLVLVDLSRVDFMPTTLLGHLIGAASRLRQAQRRLGLVGAQPQIAEVFTVAKVRSHFDFFETADAAVGWAAAKAGR